MCQKQIQLQVMKTLGYIFGIENGLMQVAYIIKKFRKPGE